MTRIEVVREKRLSGGDSEGDSMMAIEDFEVGKCYEHRTGAAMHVLVETESTIWGLTRIAESSQGELIPVTNTPTGRMFWSECTYERWLDLLM